MRAGRSEALVHKIYDEVQLFLWAMLAAFAIYFAAFVAPKLPELQAQAEFRRLQEIADENQAYCAKWQMGTGRVMHDQCLDDLETARQHPNAT